MLSLEKKEDTHPKCKACHKQYLELQLAYPQGPYYEESILSVDTEGLHLIGEKKATRQAPAEINTSFINTFSSSFSELVVKYERELQKKPTAAKAEIYIRAVSRSREQLSKRQLPLQCLSKMNLNELTSERENATTPPPSSKKPKVKSHSPDFTNVSWDKEEVLLDLQQHPQFPPPINWQKFARDHNVPGQMQAR